jgi:uncharacterized protein (TIGR03000 family)
MYSIALLMALTSGGEVSDSHRHGCGGCGGCGGYVASCGCNGGGHHRHHGGHRHRGGCCGYQAGCGCGGYVASCGCCGTPAPACGCYGGGVAPVPAPAGEPLKAMPAPKKTTGIFAPAVIVVSLPADATLAVDGAATASTSAVRTFVSPELTVGKVYEYTLSAQVVREGRSVQVQKNVTVRAGEETRVSLELPVAVVSAK